MNFEKKYKNALANARQEYNTTENVERKQWLEELFPELAESEDEKIRKVLIDYFKSYREVGTCGAETFNGIPTDNILAWLEKQNEQKPTIEIKSAEESLGIDSETYNKIVDECIYGEQNPDVKAEPKFHEGDWVVYKNEVCQIVKREEGRNKLVTVFGIEKELVNERNLSTARLWSIADAKAGDVLVSGQMIFVFNKLHGVWINCSCSFHKDGSFCEEDYDLMHIRYGKEVYPATKEQRDLLFQKMHEAGYMWDAENKQLLSLKAEPTGEIKGNQGKISPKWSEEDEKCIDNCCLLIGAADDCYEKTFKDDCIYYLQSLKERMEQ